MLIAHALNVLNGVENSNACDFDLSEFTFHIAFDLLAYIGNISSDHTKTLELIEDYRSFTALWDVNHKHYNDKIKRNYALNALATNYKTSVKEIKKKIKSLRSFFAKEHQKVVRV